MAEKSKIAETTKAFGESAKPQFKAGKPIGNKAVVKKTGFAEKGIPLYLAAAIAIFAFVAAIAFVSFTKVPEKLSPNLLPPENIDLNNASAGKLSGYFVYSSNCTVCDKSHSFLKFLTANGIEYKFSLADSTTALGTQIIANLPAQLRETPILLIEPQSVSDKMNLSIDGKKLRLIDWLYTNFRKEQLYGDFVIPESGFDNVGHTILMFDRECSSNSEIQVKIFTDPYCSECIKSISQEKTLLQKFDSNVLFNYAFVNSSDSEKIAKANGARETSLFSRYLSCIGNPKKSLDFEIAAYNAYCDSNGDKKADLNELKNCQNSPHYGKPLLQSDLDAIAKTVGVEGKTTDECVSNADITLNAQSGESNAFNINSVPMAIANCRLKGHPIAVEKMVCAINPKIKGC